MNYSPTNAGSGSAPIPYNEQDRIDALYDLNILDSEADAELDRITRLVSSHLKTPVAIVALIDKNRQWFKSCIGVEHKETDRDIAFCAHTILHDEIMVVLDATKDERFQQNPLVLGKEHIRFYAGAPLKSESGHNIGTLCVIDTKARASFGEEEQAILNDYAHMVAAILNVKKQVIETEEKTKAKTEFLSHISHELRTPLNAMIGIANILKKKPTLDPHSKSLVGTLSVSADSLLELVNSVLDISAIEARSFTLSEERFAFQKLMDEISSIMGARAAEKGLTFTIDANTLRDKYYEGDKVRLKQVLINLLSNAIKFTDQGLVTLTTNYRMSDDGSSPVIEFQVIDTGFGIPEDKIGKIFERFEQAHDKSHYEGTGLGLAITQEIVQKMGGHIRVESREGFGTKFFVTIPDKSVIKPTKKEKAEISKTIYQVDKVETIVAKPYTDHDNDREYMILVAEDYAANATLIEYILEDFGYNCEIVTNGQGVLDRLEEGGVDLVLMDINMPVLNGMETTIKIRQSENLKHIPIIAMSAHVFEEEKQQCLAAGVDDYITKPLDNDVLFEKMKYHLSEKIKAEA